MKDIDSHEGAGLEVGYHMMQRARAASVGSVFFHTLTINAKSCLWVSRALASFSS